LGSTWLNSNMSDTYIKADVSAKIP